MSCRKNPRNTVIIFQVSYGRDSEVCPYKPGKPFPFKQIFEGEGSKDPPGLPCEEDVTKMIDKRCGWKKACNVSVTSSVSDLCGPGANQYLSVVYSCGKVSKVNTEVRLMLRELIMRKKTSLVLKFLGGLGGGEGAVTLLPEKNYKMLHPPRPPSTPMILTISAFCPFSPINKSFVITASTDSDRIIPEPRLRGT